jgi:hypothetical protein
MRHLVLLLIGALSLSAQCSSTSYANGFTCVKQAGSANAGAGATATATFGSNVTAGNSVVVFAGVCADAGCNTNNATGITLTVANGASDSSTQVTGGPYVVKVQNGVSSTSIKLTAWVFSNVSATTTFTVTATGGTPFYLASYASEWSGVATASPWDVSAAAVTADAAQTTLSVTTGTTSNATDLVIGYSQNSGNAYTPGAGFTEIGESVTGIEHEAKSVASTGTQTCSWSWGANDAAQGICVTLKASGGGGGTTVTPRRRPITL